MDEYFKQCEVLHKVKKHPVKVKKPSWKTLIALGWDIVQRFLKPLCWGLETLYVCDKYFEARNNPQTKIKTSLVSQI